MKNSQNKSVKDYFRIFSFIPALFLLILAGCGKQSSKLSFEERLERDIQFTVISYNKKYKTEFEIISSDIAEEDKIRNIGKIVSSINYKTKWSERILGREFAGNNIPFHRYNKLLNKDIHKIKSMIRSINKVKFSDDFSDGKLKLESMLKKLKEIFFLVRKHKDYRNEARYKQNISNQRKTQRRVSWY